MHACVCVCARTPHSVRHVLHTAMLSGPRLTNACVASALLLPQVMLLHLAQSKFAWAHSSNLVMPAWAPPEVAPGSRSGGIGGGSGGSSSSGAVGRGSREDGARMWARGCYEVAHLGRLNATCQLCSARAPTFTEWDKAGAVERATKLRRHRVQSDFRGHILYETTRPEEVKLTARPCARRD